MLYRIVLLAVVAAIGALLTPGQVDAYGAAHVGYTHVGPNGVYHAGATETRGYGGSGEAYHAGYTTTNGAGGVYHSGYTAGYGTTGYGAAAGGYHYSTGYSGGAQSAVNYGYIR